MRRLSSNSASAERGRLKMSDSLSCMSSAMTGIGAASAKGAAKDDNATLVATTPENFYGNVKRTITNKK